MRWLTSILLLAALATASLGAPIVDNLALATAAIDLEALPPVQRPYIRYLWVSDTAAKLEREEFQATVLALNYISRAPVLFRPLPIRRDGVLVLRVDLRSLLLRDEELKEVAAAWEELRYEPKLNKLITPATLKFNPRIVAGVKGIPELEWEQVLLDCPPYTQDGQTFRQKWVWRQRFKGKEQVLRLPAEHLEPVALQRLYALTGSLAPVVTHRYFIHRALSTIKDKGAFAEIYGGLYYDFAGVKRGTAKGTDEDVLYERLGIGSVDAGLTAAKVFDKLRTDQRVAMFRSLVTGKPRRIDFLPSLSTRPGDAQPIVVVTHDLFDEDIDIDRHPIMNLLNFKDRAREVIWTQPNGLHGFALFNDKGELQDEVPPNVAMDTTIPRPHTQRLQAAIGCIRCHGTDSGWKPAPNHAQTILKKRFDIDDDTTARSPSDATRRLAGLYTGDLERRLLPRGRQDYAAAVLRVTGPWDESKDQTDLVKRSAERIGDVHRRYWYDAVDAAKALAELGIEHDGKTSAVEVLEKRLPPVLADAEPGRLVPEDPRIEALLSGLSIPRSDWDLVYAFVAARVRR